MREAISSWEGPYLHRKRDVLKQQVLACGVGGGGYFVGTCFHKHGV
jgi:hypothetical protein